MIINHETPAYSRRWEMSGNDRYNGAYYYSQDICKYIIPNIDTDRHWVTVNQKGKCFNHSIVFIHNNMNPEELYDWLKDYEDLVLVCGIPETVDRVKHLGTAIYLPLSIDVEYVESFKVQPFEVLNKTAYVGRRNKAKNIPKDVTMLTDMPRRELLQTMARFKYVMAVGRCAIEAKALGCKLKAYDERFPKTSIWKVIDCSEAVEILQAELDRIDKGADEDDTEEKI